MQCWPRQKQPPEEVCKKNVLLEISQNSRKTPVPEFFAEACNFILKETLAQVFSCEFCDVSKNTFVTEHLWPTASAQIDPDKIVNYFSVKSCLRTVDQHYTAKFLVQFRLRQIKTTLHIVIFLRKDDYKQKQPFADVFQNRCF